MLQLAFLQMRIALDLFFFLFFFLKTGNGLIIFNSFYFF